MISKEPRNIFISEALSYSSGVAGEESHNPNDVAVLGLVSKPDSSLPCSLISDPSTRDLTSFDSETKPHEQSFVIVEKEALDDFKSLKRKERREIKKLILRLKLCGTFYLKRECKDCGHDLGTIEHHCKNRLCAYDPCTETRRVEAWHDLQQYKIRSERLRHLTLGFVIQTGESKEQKRLRDYLFKRIRRIFKRCGVEIHALVVEDMRVDVIQGFKRFYMHLHLAILPPKDERQFRLAIRKAQEMLKGKATIIDLGFTPTKSLLQYFAKIMAGLFSTKEKHHTANLRQLLSPAEFLEFFSRRKLLRVWGMRKFVCAPYGMPPGHSPGNLAELGCSGKQIYPKCCHHNIRITKIPKEEIDPGGFEPGMTKKLYITQKQFSPRSYEESIIIGTIQHAKQLPQETFPS